VRLNATNGAVPLTYVVPLRWEEDSDVVELTAYLRWLSAYAGVIVVDGSPAPLFQAHREAWGSFVQHVAPAQRAGRNGKVAGVHTGVCLATTEHVVIADDDVRYDARSLAAVVRLLADADLVGPQNVFEPLPWHAAWDTSRSLLNRAVAADYPGTFGLRRSTFLAMGGYDGDVLFENLELMRTVRAFGGRVVRPRDVYVTRRPPSAARFRTQRVRQAFDDLAQPWRLVTFLATLPVSAVAVSRHGASPLVAAAAGLVAVAECGRRRAGGAAVFPARTSWFAPLWVGERALCSWVALGQLVLRGGVDYAGSRLSVAAHSTGWIRHRMQTAPRPLVATRRAEPPGSMRAVAEGLEPRAAAAAQRDGRPARVDLAAG
jgi:hypothetical protein